MISYAVRIHTAAPVTVGIRPTLPDISRLASASHGRISETVPYTASSFAALSVTELTSGILPILDDFIFIIRKSNGLVKGEVHFFAVFLSFGVDFLWFFSKFKKYSQKNPSFFEVFPVGSRYIYKFVL